LKQLVDAITRTRAGADLRRGDGLADLDAQKVLAVFDEVSIPVFVLLQGPLDRVQLDWRFLGK